MKFEVSTQGASNKERKGFYLFLKAVFIGFLTLILFIPSVLISELTEERRERQSEVEADIASAWSKPQLIQGPLLMIPIAETKASGDRLNNPDAAPGPEKFVFLLPDTLHVAAETKTEIRNRGIFNASVYQSEVVMQGSFSLRSLSASKVDSSALRWQDAKVVVGLSDLKGLRSSPLINIAGKELEAEPDFSGLVLFEKNLVIRPDKDLFQSPEFDFSVALSLRGSKYLQFLHLAKKTNVQVRGDWASPAFTGRVLPESREVTDRGFTATWVLPHYNRHIPQQWTGTNQPLVKMPVSGSEKGITSDQAEGTFGVSFIRPADTYQKVVRTVKYALLVILLTFIALLYTELATKRSIHPLQYLLTGAAMVVFYALLLAISEHTGFGIAYLTASAATIGLIALFVFTLLGSRRMALTIAVIQGVFYSFIYYIIQLEDLALLAGSIGLFVVVAVLMFLSQRMLKDNETLQRDATT